MWENPNCVEHLKVKIGFFFLSGKRLEEMSWLEGFFLNSLEYLEHEGGNVVAESTTGR